MNLLRELFASKADREKRAAEVTKLRDLFRAHAVEPKDCAHLSIDVQKIYADATEARRIARVVAPNFRAAAIQNYWIHYSHGLPGEYGLLNEYAFLEVRPEPGEPVISKTEISAFGGSDIHDQLQAAGTKLVALTGFVMDCCVRATALDARDKGYHVVLFSDCTNYRGSETIAARELAQAGVIITESDNFFNALKTAHGSNQNSISGEKTFRHGG